MGGLSKRWRSNSVCTKKLHYKDVLFEHHCVRAEYAHLSYALQIGKLLLSLADEEKWV